MVKANPRNAIIYFNIVSPEFYFKLAQRWTIDLLRTRHSSLFRVPVFFLSIFRLRFFSFKDKTEIKSFVNWRYIRDL